MAFNLVGRVNILPCCSIPGQTHERHMLVFSTVSVLNLVFYFHAIRNVGSRKAQSIVIGVENMAHQSSCIFRIEDEEVLRVPFYKPFSFIPRIVLDDVTQQI
jgi:hypothetical protein